MYVQSEYNYFWLDLMSIFLNISKKISLIDLPVITRFDLNKIITSELLKNKYWIKFSDKEKKDIFDLSKKYLTEIYKLYHSRHEVFLLSDEVPYNLIFEKNFLDNNSFLRLGVSNYFFYKTGNHNDIYRIACYLDPWSYLSHRTAMKFWGIDSDNNENKEVYLTSLKKDKWILNSKEEYEKCLNEKHIMEFCRRRSFFEFEKKMFDYDFYISRTDSIEDYIEHNGCKYASFEKTYLDMLTGPEKCGGIKFVIDCFKRINKSNLESLIKFFDSKKYFLPKIMMCRVGFIFNEVVKVESDVIDSWICFKSRGSSSKLDQKSPFSSRFSEKWDLSINIDL